MNIALDDSDTKILDAVGEYPTGYKDGRLKINLPNEIWKDISEGTVIKLLTSKEDEQRFEIKPSRPETLTVPKK